MTKQLEKPTPEAKALSLFLMAHKSSSPVYKEKSKRINRLWSLVLQDELSEDEYLKEVHDTLASYGGYLEVVEKTVRFYIEKTGVWKLIGDDQYCKDANKIAEKVLSE
jgi:hypothetical protein